ncbi:hypothetical protein V8E36_008804 [Tilletia maclaganii]
MTTRSTGADTSSRGPGREDRENQQHTTSFVDEGESMGQSQGGTSMSSAAKKRKGKLPRSAQNEQLVDGTTGKRRRLLLPPSCIDPDDTAEEKLHRSHNRELPVLRPISQQTLITSHTSASGAPSTVLSNTQLPSTRYFVEASEDEDDDYYFDFFGGSFNSNKGVRAAALPAISSEETESTSTRSSKYSRRKDSIQRQELDRQRAEERLEQVGERAAVRQQLSFNTAASGNTHSRSSTPSPQHNKQEISLSNATSAAARLGRYVPSSPFASHGGRSATQTASGSPAGSRPATSGKRASDLGTRTGHSSSFLGAVAVASSSRAFDFDMRIHSSSAAAGYGSSTARDQARDEELQEAAKEALAAAKSALATATKQSSTVTVQSSRPKRAAAKRAADQISSIGSAFISISSAEDEDRREYRPTEEHHVAPVDHHHSNRRSKKTSLPTASHCIKTRESRRWLAMMRPFSKRMTSPRRPKTSLPQCVCLPTGRSSFQQGCPRIRKSFKTLSPQSAAHSSQRPPNPLKQMKTTDPTSHQGYRISVGKVEQLAPLHSQSLQTFWSRDIEKMPDPVKAALSRRAVTKLVAERWGSQAEPLLPMKDRLAAQRGGRRTFSTLNDHVPELVQRLQSDLKRGLSNFSQHELAEFQAKPEGYIKLLTDSDTLSMIRHALQDTTLSADWLYVEEDGHLVKRCDDHLNNKPWDATLGISFSATVAKHTLEQYDPSANAVDPSANTVPSTSTAPASSTQTPVQASPQPPASPPPYPLLALRNRIQLPEDPHDETAVFNLLRLTRQVHSSIASTQRQMMCLCIRLLPDVGGSSTRSPKASV